MKSYSLNVKKRTKSEKGKNQVRRLRRSGHIPANLIAKGQSLPLSFGEKDFRNLINRGLGSSSIVDLNIEDRENPQAIVKELQRHPIDGRFLHVDFYQISKGERLWVKIAIEAKGLAKGVKAGGALEQYIHSIKVRTVPEKLQESIELDVTNLEKGDTVHLNELNLPKEWKTLIEGNPIVLKISRARIALSDAEETEEQKESTETIETEKNKADSKT